MEERLLRIRVGMFVVLALVVLGILIFINSEGFQPKYSLFINTPTAPGVQKDTPIRKNGILIGRVGAVRTDDDSVKVELRINRDAHVFENEVVSIGTDSILGDAVIEVVPVGSEKRGAQLARGDSLKFVSVKRNPMDIVDVAINLESKIADALDTVRRAGASVEEAGKGVRQLTDQVTSALGNSDSDIKQLLTNFQETNRKAQVALDNFNKIFEGINEVVGDVEMKNRFRETLRKLPEVFDEVRNTIVNTRDTINSFREVSSKLGTNLDNLDGFTSSLKEVGPEILDQVYTSLQNIDQLVGQIRNFTGKIDQMQKGEGTVGKLLTDPTLYNNANEAVANVKELTYKLEPLVNDLRMFADSLARDPRQLGVRGAMDLRPLGTGYKGTVPGRQDQQPSGAEKSGSEIRR